jgi:hypothetical protein
MNTPDLFSRAALRRVLASALVVSATAISLRAEAIAVYSAVYNGYSRQRQTDDSYRVETYAFGNAGRWDAPFVDESMENVSFRNVAFTLAKPLRDQAYVPSADKNNIDLLILVSWGTTVGSGDLSRSAAGQGAMAATQLARVPHQIVKADAYRSDKGQQSTVQFLKDPDENDLTRRDTESALDYLHMENHQRDRIDDRNATLLGYNHDLWRAISMPRTSYSKDIFEELSQNRYFVVLKAYDFKTLRETKKFKLLWETRYSIVEQGNSFTQQLENMTRYASQYFGQDTRGLVRRPLPTTNVEVGEAKVLPEGRDRR